MIQSVSKRTRSCVLSASLLAAIPAASAADTQNGPAFDLSAYRGKVVYLDFWASWCAPCLQSFPWMTEVQRIYGRQLVIVAVNVDHDRNQAQAFLRDRLVNFRIVYDPDGVIAKQYAIKDMPTSILIGPDGRTRYVHSGFYINRETEYASHVAEVLHDIHS
jgi:cytochrome c biogenesis protein CcmG, thiol:disulfide interchange protein DsbE